VKTVAVASPGAGQVEETVTRKRIVPADVVGAQKTPDFWDYIEGLKPEDWSPYRHKLFIYRYVREDAPVAMDPLEKNETGLLVMLDNTQVPINNREEVEFGIAQKFGGGLFRLILKRGSERVTETRVHTEGPRKMVAPIRNESTSPTITTMQDATAEVAHHAINTLAGQDRVVMDVAVNAVKGAAEIVQRMSAASSGGGSEADQMFRLMMVKALERMMAPPPDPLDLLTKLLTLQAQLNPSGQANPILARVLDGAVEKLLNPPATGPSSSAGAELVRQLPQVASYVSSAIAEWRAGMEAQRDTAGIMRGVQPSGTGRPQPNPATILPAPAAQPKAEGPVGAPSFEFIESRVVKIMSESETVEEAAENVAEFLHTMDSGAVAQLTALGEAGLMNFFCTRPMLKPATTNLPKLQEFIQAFLKYASENGATEAGAKPN